MPPTSNVQRRSTATSMLFLLLVTLSVVDRSSASCVRVDNEDLIEYKCEGGSVEDLKQIPNNVEKIRVTNMPIGKLDDSLLARFGDSLLVLSCSHCLISDVSDGAFRSLRNLQQLSLDNNQLREVRAGWFEPGLDYLTYLDLNYNQIETFDAQLFSRAPSLVDLRLSGNRLECLDLQALSKLHDLKRIFLNENPNFGCPNALGKYLQSRGIDYEPDPQWTNQPYDRIPSNDRPYITEPRPAAPPVPTLPTTTSPRYVPTTTPIPTPPRRPYVPPETYQPSSPGQDFGFNQGPYYEPTVVPQRPGNYRNPPAPTLPAAATTTTTTATSTIPTTMIVTSTEPTTTECPNNSATFIRPAILVFVVTLLGLFKWTQY